jgi:hypothetical protein
MLGNLTTISFIRLLEYQVAEEITTTTLNLHNFKPCYWCGSSPQHLMSPYDFRTSSGRLFCTMCGRDSQNTLDGRMMGLLVAALCNQKHPWHAAVQEFLEYEEPELCGLKTWDSHWTLNLRPHSGLPQSLQIDARLADDTRQRIAVYDWSFAWLVCQAMNQTVSRRIDYVPLFDLGSRSACLNCGAGPERQHMRNFSEVLREGDIYCGGCGKYIRTWDPS